MFSKGSFQFTSIPFQEKYFLTWTTELHSVICFMEKTILRLKFYPKLQKKINFIFYGYIFWRSPKIKKVPECAQKGGSNPIWARPKYQIDTYFFIVVLPEMFVLF